MVKGARGWCVQLQYARCSAITANGQDQAFQCVLHDAKMWAGHGDGHANCGRCVSAYELPLDLVPSEDLTIYHSQIPIIKQIPLQYLMHPNQASLHSIVNFFNYEFNYHLITGN